MTAIHKSKQREKNTIRSERDQRRRQILTCDWEECAKVCRTRAGLKAHERMKQNDSESI